MKDRNYSSSTALFRRITCWTVSCVALLATSVSASAQVSGGSANLVQVGGSRAEAVSGRTRSKSVTIQANLQPPGRLQIRGEEGWDDGFRARDAARVVQAVMRDLPDNSEARRFAADVSSLVERSRSLVSLGSTRAGSPVGGKAEGEKGRSRGGATLGVRLDRGFELEVRGDGGLRLGVDVRKQQAILEYKTSF